MHIDEALEKLMQDDKAYEMPDWAVPMNKKIDAIYEAIQALNDIHQEEAYRAFLRQIRRMLRAVPAKRIYPRILYGTMEIGVDKEGRLFDIETGQALSAKEAHDVYAFLFDRRNNLQKYITGAVL